MKFLRIFLNFLLFLIFCAKATAQQLSALPDGIFHQQHFTFNSLLLTSRGSVLIASSRELFEDDAQVMQATCSYPNQTTEKGKPAFFGKNSNITKDLFESDPGIKLMSQGLNQVTYVVTKNNNLGYINYQHDGCIIPPPINFQDAAHEKVITAILLDATGTLFIGTEKGIVYYIENAAKIQGTRYAEGKFLFEYGLDKDSNNVVISGALPIKQFSLGDGVIPHTFAKTASRDGELFVGTNQGLFTCNWKKNTFFNYFKSLANGNCTITKILPDKLGINFWISTLEFGMGNFRRFSKSLVFYPYPKKINSRSATYPIANFSLKSPNEFYVAIIDSTPAIFNTDKGEYSFISDTSFHQSANSTSDILQDTQGFLYLIKGGILYNGLSSSFGSSGLSIDSSLVGPFVKNILIGDKNYGNSHSFEGRLEDIKEFFFNNNENTISVLYSSRGMLSDSLIFAWKVDESGETWTEREYSEYGDEMNSVNLRSLAPGRYTVRIRVKKMGSEWVPKEAVLIVNISRPYWQTWWFWTSVLLGLSSLIYLIVRWRTARVRKEERSKAAREKEILELEAKALRAQMNPHFIFNCLNSIKDLIQKDQKEKSITYLATFSKLIRTIFQNSEKREITLFNELENCRLYTELESLRFGSKLSYTFLVEENIDLKSVMVPSLIIQPFIENAIWHGLMPKETGGRLEVQVSTNHHKIFCIIDDNGIGRELSWQHKTFEVHDSRGVRLTQTRLELSNSINQQNATVEIIDKKDAAGEPTGTRVILSFAME